MSVKIHLSARKQKCSGKLESAKHTKKKSRIVKYLHNMGDIRVSRFIFVLTVVTLASVCLSTAVDKPQKIAIIKADDVRGKNAKWDRFFAVSKERGVKVSAGIICNSLQGDKGDYFEWLRKHHASGFVEFWNHGWDHKQWETDD